MAITSAVTMSALSLLFPWRLRYEIPALGVLESFGAVDFDRDLL